MLMKERPFERPEARPRAFSLLLETGAIRACEDHGWMKDRTDPHARQRAIEIAREEPPPGISQDQAVAAIEDILGSIGDTCPECT